MEILGVNSGVVLDEFWMGGCARRTVSGTFHYDEANNTELVHIPLPRRVSAGRHIFLHENNLEFMATLFSDPSFSVLLVILTLIFRCLFFQTLRHRMPNVSVNSSSSYHREAELPKCR